MPPFDSVGGVTGRGSCRRSEVSPSRESATCGVIEFELGWAARTAAEFDQLRADRDAGYEWLAIHDEDWRRALDVQAALWRSGQIRAVGFPDLLVSAVAERERVTLLHYDR